MRDGTRHMAQGTPHTQHTAHSALRTAHTAHAHAPTARPPGARSDSSAPASLRASLRTMLQRGTSAMASGPPAAGLRREGLHMASRQNARPSLPLGVSQRSLRPHRSYHVLTSSSNSCQYLAGSGSLPLRLCHLPLARPMAHGTLGASPPSTLSSRRGDAMATNTLASF